MHEWMLFWARPCNGHRGEKEEEEDAGSMQGFDTSLHAEL